MTKGRFMIAFGGRRVDGTFVGFYAHPDLQLPPPPGISDEACEYVLFDDLTMIWY